MRIWVVLLAVGAVPALAQDAAPEIRRALPAGESAPGASPEIRRAQPIGPATYRNPDWMSRIPRATAVNPPPPPPPSPTPVPVATPLPLEPKETPLPAPAPPAPGLAPAGQGADAQPAAPGQNRSLLAANGFYRRKMYDMAVFDYEKFLIAEPDAAGRDGALFRLGESHRFLGNSAGARDAYQRLLSEFREGEFVGAGAYRLGEIYYGEGNYTAALAMFQKAEGNSQEPEVKLSAQFYQANSFDRMGRRPQAAQEFADIAKAGGENPYRDTAQFYVAEEAARTGRKQDAFTSYEKLSNDAEKPEVKAEATVKAAALAAEMGRGQRARELFEKALALPGIGDWRGVARLGVLRLAYDKGDYKEAAQLADQDLRDLPPDSAAEALLISANASRQLGDVKKALELYDRIKRDYPRSDAATQANFQRLVCLEATGAADLPKQIDDFLAASTDPRERVQATLLKAETVFKTGDYAGAAPLYAGVLRATLPLRLRSQARYKLGWCQLQLKQYKEAADTFTAFIEDNPKSELLPAAFTQRAVAFQQTKAYDDALRDFDRIISDYPKAKEREVALQQKALIQGQQEQYDAMAKTFAQLLSEYPKTKSAAQAEFWIGWAAFEKKDYPTAVEHLKKARELDPKAFGDRATQRIVLAAFYKEDRDAVLAEIGNTRLDLLPAEVLMWLGSKSFDDGDYKKTEQFLGPVLARGAANSDVLLDLAKARLAQKKYEDALEPVRQYIAQARDPLSRAKGLLASAEVSLGTGNYADAGKLIDEALILQPEGHYNAEARLLAGLVQMRRGENADAARAFMTISVLYDDAEVTPRALALAARAYEKSGNDAESQKALAELKQRYPKAADKLNDE